MTTSNEPVLGKKQLLKSLIIALVLGAVVLFTAVLPAEYGIDPLGTGKLFGFSDLYQKEAPVSSSLNFKKIELDNLGSSPDVAKPEEANLPPPATQYVQRKDSITVTVTAGKGIEYKVKVKKYGSVKYEWATDQGIVYTDFHGEVKEQNPPEDVFYESYTQAYSNNMAGTFTAPFNGKHGWYFRNKTEKDIIVTIKLEGAYELF